MMNQRDFGSIDPEQDKGAIFVDIDGTLVDSRTEEPIPGAIETINELYDRGYEIIVTTRRGNQFGHASRYTELNTRFLLTNIGLKYDRILYNVASPRIIINDAGAGAIDIEDEKGWNNVTPDSVDTMAKELYPR